jgi:hypothetical protein
LFVFPILTKERAERHLRNGLEIYETNVPMLSSAEFRSGCSCKAGNAPQVCAGRSYRRPLRGRRLTRRCVAPIQVEVLETVASVQADLQAACTTNVLHGRSRPAYSSS